MVNEDGFAATIEGLRKAGAKYIFLKTGAYRPVDLARAIAFSSKYKLDLLTVDAAGGGTGMSPWRMMNEWGVPPVELHTLVYQYAKQLADKKKHLPAISVNGGFTFEDQIFKALAMGSPYVKMVGMARSPIAAAMVGKTIGRTIEAQQVPVYIERFGHSKDEIFVTAASLRKELGDKEFEKLPTGAIGLYTYYERLAQGLRQLMAGSRKFSLEYMSRNDLASLTPEGSRVSGIQYIMDVDKDEAAEVLHF
jgi:glutamate synthase domain-containing protein 2